LRPTSKASRQCLVDRSQDRRQELERLSLLLSDWERGLPPPPPDYRPEPLLDEQIKRRLKALGYLDLAWQ
jgi:hypothetical protein